MKNHGLPKKKTNLNVVQIDTKRLLLRSVSLGDEAVIFPEIDKELTADWIGWEPPASPKAQRKIISRSIRKSASEFHLNLAAFEKKKHEFIGCCGISKSDFDDFELNVWVKHSAQRKKYATEMLDALLAWARKHTSLPYLVYSVTSGNKASEHIAKKYNAATLRAWNGEKRGKKRSIKDFKLTF